MTQETEAEKRLGWRQFISKHKTIFAVFIAAGILVAIGAIYVFLWFVGQAQTSGLVPSTLGLWSMANTVNFILHAVFWELLLVGIPAVIGALIGWQWWRKIPEAEKKQYNLSEGRSRSKGAGGAVSPLLFIAFAIKVYVDGNWNVAISTWKLDYVVGSMIAILAWIVAIFAIPAIIVFVWWIRHEMTNKP
jgi:hypothetical protein